MKIVNQQIKADGNRFYLEIEFDEFFDHDWIRAYRDGLLEMDGFTYTFGSGCPTVNAVSFDGKKALTNPFPEMAKPDLKTFLSQFARAVESMNTVHERMMVKEKAEEEKEKQAEKDREAKLKEMNDWIK